MLPMRIPIAAGHDSVNLQAADEIEEVKSSPSASPSSLPVTELLPVAPSRVPQVGESSTSKRLRDEIAPENTGASENRVSEISIDISEQTLVQVALDNIPWSSRAAEDQPYHEKQRQLEQVFVDWAAQLVKARQQAFGPAYVFGVDMRAPVKEALLPALYDGVRQFIFAAARGPIRNATVTIVGPRKNEAGQNIGELNNEFSATMAGGAVGGVSAYLTEAWLLQAMDRRAHLSNLAKLEPVDMHLLAPDPGPVQLRLVNGTKEYWCPASDQYGGHAEMGKDDTDPSLPHDTDPTLTMLKDQAAELRASWVRWQGNIEGKGMLSWFRPGLSGAFNTARRTLSTAQLLKSPLPLFGTSVLATSAGGVANFTIGMSKAMPWMSQVQSDNLIGGTQTLNLFKLTIPQPNRPAVSWRDAASFPNYAKDVMWEMGGRIKHSFDPQRSWRDFSVQTKDAIRNVAISAIGSMLSAGAGKKLAELMRNGNPTELPGESFKAGSSLLQQFGQSTTYDYVWEAFRDFTKSDTYDISPSLDRARDQKQLSLLFQAKQECGKLLVLMYEWRRLMPPHVQDIEHIALQSDLLERDLNAAQIKATHDALKSESVSTCQRSSAQLHLYAKLINTTEKVMKLINQRDALVAKRSPVP
ncbi:outer protein F2 [Herbaspirillum rubrisubalbicans M1]|nr:outer protein F2 [Herbaspirillum rubrisubalbicans M1]